MPSPIPPRDRKVFFVGAGLSCAFRLPNTANLLTEAVAFSRTGPGHWLHDEDLEPRLKTAYKFFYPDAAHPGFQPQAVDFFSALRCYIDIGSGLVGTGFDNAPDLYRLLRRGIAHLLANRTKVSASLSGFSRHSYLEGMLQPGHIIITSNWDNIIEQFAAANSIPLRLTSRSRKFDQKEVSLLKLHGSIDWCQQRSRSTKYTDSDFAALSELQNPPRIYTMNLDASDGALIRVRSDGSDSWQKIRSRSREPYMVTMATGKADDLGPLLPVWRDAYRALSRARALEIVGYSMPPDDVEIRTILRTGIQRGSQNPHITVRNPAPDVHQRVRTYLDRNAESDYITIDSVK